MELNNIGNFVAKKKAAKEKPAEETKEEEDDLEGEGWKKQKISSLVGNISYF